jgi:hypothetical protein
MAQDAPKSGPEQERLKAFIGNWTLTLETKRSPDPEAPSTRKMLR